MTEIPVGRYAWLFDQRFDTLRPSFEEYLASHGYGGASPLNGYDLFPDVAQCGAANDLPELRQLSPEEVNRRFIDAWDRGQRWGSAHQSLPVVSFIADGLEDRPGLSLFGPSPDLVHRLSSKAFQYTWFRDSGLPTPPFAVFDGIEDLAMNLDDCLTRHEALFVQPSYSSGGEQAAVICSAQDLALYRERLRTLDRLTDTLVAARFIPDCRTLSGNGLVTRGGNVLLLGVDELLQDSYRFDGFIFPTFESPEVEAEILGLTKEVGRLLADRGYWGYFTADVIRPPDGPVLLTEANVRFAGEAAFLAACTPHNLFRLLADEDTPESDQLVPRMPDRIMATKIRPRIGQTVFPCPADGSVNGFLSHDEEQFRVVFLSSSVHVMGGHFVGVAGRRFPLPAKHEEIIQFYQFARAPKSPCSSCATTVTKD